MSRFHLLAIILALSACNDDVTNESCSGMCSVYTAEHPGVGECVAGTCSPTFGECVIRDETSTCSEACAAQGSVCAENQCAGYTYLLYGGPPLCEDPDRQGASVAHGCDEPIDWQFNTAARCCCEQPQP